MQLNLGNGLVLNEENRVVFITEKDYDEVPDLLKQLMKNDLTGFKVVTDEVYYKDVAFMAPKYSLNSAKVDDIIDMLDTNETLLILSIQLYSPTLIEKVKESNKHYLICIEHDND